ncbi:MAG: L-2-hydroxyglutarate oxidase [Planctomycetota bacterium]
MASLFPGREPAVPYCVGAEVAARRIADYPRNMNAEVDRESDVVVIGAGIVGLAAARAIHGASVTVIEAEPRVAAHQTGNNSGVIHAGLYYRPGSEKARHCAEGRVALYRYCEERSISHERCGKLVVATSDDQIPALEELQRRGRANGIDGIRRIGPDEVREIEPFARATAALRVPVTGIVDYGRVAECYAEDVRSHGRVETGATFLAVDRRGDRLEVETSAGTIRCRVLVGCAGLQSDRVARACGVEPGVRIVPFRGEYYEVVPERSHLVKHLIYPVPDARFPFLGVHFTRRIGGEIEAGPNAVLTLKRTGYRKGSFSARDAWSTLTYPGFWRLATRHLRMGAAESWRSLSRRAFVRSLQELVPEIGTADVRRAGAGVRAQALAPDGALVDDFHIVEADRMVHVLNAPSPAATASLSIGGAIAERVTAQLERTRASVVATPAVGPADAG